jgi:hypothetical protein
LTRGLDTNSENQPVGQITCIIPLNCIDYSATSVAIDASGCVRKNINATNAEQPKIISIFLASRLEKSTIDWLFYGWLDLHIATGYFWHLLVPTIVPIDDQLAKATADNSNSLLAAPHRSP